MALSKGERAGKVVTNSMRDTEFVAENISPSASDAVFFVLRDETVKVSGNVTVVKKFFEDNAFVLDHPVLGELDSATLQLDLGYDDSADEVVVNKDF